MRDTRVMQEVSRADPCDVPSPKRRVIHSSKWRHGRRHSLELCPGKTPRNITTMATSTYSRLTQTSNPPPMCKQKLEESSTSLLQILDRKRTITLPESSRSVQNLSYYNRKSIPYLLLKNERFTTINHKYLIKIEFYPNVEIN